MPNRSVPLSKTSDICINVPIIDAKFHSYITGRKCRTSGDMSFPIMDVIYLFYMQ